MEETQKTQRQLKTEALQRDQANRSFVNHAERLIQWAAFKDLLLGDFYQGILNLATANEDQDIGIGFGFIIYLYDTSHKHPYFFSNGAGLCGFSELVGSATEWLGDEINDQTCYQRTEAPPDITVGDEMENGYLRDNLSAFSDACEAIGNTDSDVNLLIDFYPSYEDMPNDLDFGNMETESLNYPDSLQKKFESMLNDIMDN